MGYAEQYAPKHCMFLGQYFEKFVKARNGEIMIGGLVTTLATSIGYERKL